MELNFLSWVWSWRSSRLMSFLNASCPVVVLFSLHGYNQQVFIIDYYSDSEVHQKKYTWYHNRRTKKWLTITKWLKIMSQRFILFVISSYVWQSVLFYTDVIWLLNGVDMIILWELWRRHKHKLETGCCCGMNFCDHNSIVFSGGELFLVLLLNAAINGRWSAKARVLNEPHLVSGNAASKAGLASHGHSQKWKH